MELLSGRGDHPMSLLTEFRPIVFGTKFWTNVPLIFVCSTMGFISFWAGALTTSGKGTSIVEYLRIRRLTETSRTLWDLVLETDWTILGEVIWNTIGLIEPKRLLASLFPTSRHQLCPA